ncbi:MAG: hypothetical protein GWP08_07100 [Nitrospiraceae bacterium]|nr:hypothetical protein [Nitrospiraceae bacterium]
MIIALIGMTALHAIELPAGASPDPVTFEHFPDRLHTFVWVNWELVPTERLAEVAGATPQQIAELGRSMGLPEPPAISEDQWRRSYITIIRRNWHLLPYEQMLTLLDWTAQKLAFTLREDDFLYIKLGSLKPKCEPLVYAPPSAQAAARASEIRAVVSEAFPQGLAKAEDPLFGFVARLSAMPEGPTAPGTSDSETPLFSPRFCSSYFMLYGDPFLETETEAYPDGYLARLADSGVSGVWLQAVLYKLSPFPWDEKRSEHWQERLVNLGKLVARAKRHGIGVYLYLNEPRAMPLDFYEERPEMKGVVEGDYAAMCTSNPAVQDYLRSAVSTICKAVPDLAGFFTISGSENLTNCWSHRHGERCPRCKDRGPEVVISELHGLIREGIVQAGAQTRLIAWDWGWPDGWVEGIVGRLPKEVSLMSVSEWSIPVTRGGIDTVVGEYSISVVGPGPRATRHWGFARSRGLKTLAKVQAGNTWELSAVPYIPAVANVAQHAANLRKANVDGLMLGWTLGGYPSPNLEVFAESGRPEERSVDEVLQVVAARRYGASAAPAVVKAWKAYSVAFSEFPYNGGLLYNAPIQMGPANPLWAEDTGYAATMVGLPYDNFPRWRANFPEDVFIGQFKKMADGFDAALDALRRSAKDIELTPSQRTALASEMDVAEASAIHFRSVANQARFVQARQALATAKDEAARPLLDTLEHVLESEASLAVRLHAIQQRDSRIGFEASNHYFYVPGDLAAKVVNCRYLLTHWLPGERAKRGLGG